MNNWRLLLALVAVVQPIASFTEGNFDGRHQCCDRQSQPLLRDSPYGPRQISKTTALSRINQRDEIRGDRLREIKQQDLGPSRLSSDTSLLRIRGRDTREASPRSLTKSRSEYRLARIGNDYNRERVPSREESLFVRATGDIRREKQNRRVVREFNGKRVLETSRISRDRDISRTRRGDERLSEYSPDTRREIRRRYLHNQESKNIFRRTRDVTNTREDVSDALKNQWHVRATSNMVRRERSPNGDVRISLVYGSERQTTVNRDTHLLFQGTQAVHEVRDTRVRINLREEKRGNADARLIGTTGFSERRQQRESTREFRNRNTAIPKSTRVNMQINDDNVRQSGPVSRIINDANFNVQKLSENRNEFRTHERRFRESPDERIRANLGELRDDGRLSKQRNNKKDIRDNERRVREGSSENRREIRSAARMNAIRVNERRVRERNGENRREIMSAKRMNDIRDSERRVREIHSENRRQIRSAERMNDISDNERRVRERNGENRREIRSAKRMNAIRDNERHVIARNSETRREIRSAERMNDIRDNERHVKARNIETRREIRSAERMTDIRDNERHVKARKSETRREIRSAERMNDIRDNESRVRGRNSENRREIRGAERMNDIRDNERRVRERNSETRRENRSTKIIRDTQDNERRLRENRNIATRFIENMDDIRNNRKEIRDDERQIRSRNSESGTETQRDNSRKNGENTLVIRKFKYDESRFHDMRDAIVSGNRREISNTRDLREIRDARPTHRRSLEARTSGVTQRDNILLNRRTRSTELGHIQDKAQTWLVRSKISQERGVSRLPIKFLANDKTTDKETTNSRFQNVESAMNRGNSVSVTQQEIEYDESVIANWQYVFYTLQGIYLCGLLMQVLTPKAPEKLKIGKWWHLNSQRLLKVD